MKDFQLKINNSPTSAGNVIDEEYNSMFRENKGAVVPFMSLDGNQNDQLVRSIDIASKAMFYGDVGSVNSVHLTRGATTDQIETLFDGMVVMFSPSFENTGSATLKVHALLAKSMKLGGLDLVAGELVAGRIYIAIYSLSADVFNIFNINLSDDSVGTPELKDDSVTLDKMAQGTPGNFMKYGTAGNAASVNDFVASKTENGYQQLPSGLIMQWGDTSLTANVQKGVILPQAYLNDGLVAVVGGSGVGVVQVQGVGPTGITLLSTSNHQHCWWMAYGY